MGRKKQKWGIGDIVMIPRSDGQFVPGQIVDVTPQALNSAVLALFDVPCESMEVSSVLLPRERLFSVVFVTRDQLDSGRWKVVGQSSVKLPEGLIPSTGMAAKGFVGAKIYGSGIVENFIDAYYSLCPWDMYYTPDYFDKMLISQIRKPKTLLFK